MANRLVSECFKQVYPGGCIIMLHNPYFPSNKKKSCQLNISMIGYMYKIMKGRKNTMLNTKQQEFVDYAVKKFGSNELSVAQLKDANKHFGCKYAPQWLIKNADYKIGKSMFKLPTESGEVSTTKISNVKSGEPRKSFDYYT